MENDLSLSDPVISTEERSGATDRVEKSCAVRIGDKRLPFHAFTLFKGEGGPLAVDEG